MSVLILNQRLIKRGVQLFYSSKDLSSCLSHIYSSQESITLTSKPDKLKKSRMLQQKKQSATTSWHGQSNCIIRFHSDCCTVTGGGGVKTTLLKDVFKYS